MEAKFNEINPPETEADNGHISGANRID